MSNLKTTIALFLEENKEDFDFSRKGEVKRSFDLFQEKHPETCSYTRFSGIKKEWSAGVLVQRPKAPVGAFVPTKLLKDFKTIKLKNEGFTKDSFPVVRTGKLIDTMFSDLDENGGIVTGLYFMIGDPGVGKTTLLADICISAENFSAKQVEAGESNKLVKTLVINAEMSKTDFAYEALKTPTLNNLSMVFMDDYTDYDPRQVLEGYFGGGYDIIVLDSWKTIQSRVKLFCSLQGIKISDNSLEAWFLQTLKKYNELHKTRFIIIQQINKDGSGAGSKALEHDTTGWIEVRHEHKTGRRKIVFIKNRRSGNCINIPLYYSKAADGSIEYDAEALATYKESSEIQAENAKAIAELERSFDNTLDEEGGVKIDLSLLGRIVD